MSTLDFIDNLLDGAEVKWEALGKVTSATKNVKWQEHDTPLQYIDLTSVCRERKCIIETTEVSESDAPSRAKKLVQEDDVIFATTRPTQLRYCLIGAKYSGQIASTGYCVLRANTEKVLPKWILYCIATTDFKKFVEEKQSGAAYPAISDKQVKEYMIPIPYSECPEKSLEIQAEIVRILDTFTELTTELTTELSARKKQYNYYRDQLLSFDEGEVEWKALGKIALINTGQKPSEILSDATDFDYINAGTTRSGYASGSNCEGDTVTTPSRGQGGIGYVGYQQEAFWLGPLCYKMRSLDETLLVNKYLFYFLQSRNKLLLGLKKEGGVPAVNKSDLAKLEIPVPSLGRQKHIVAILDNFYTLTNSISEGLPREIELRQNQYVYYRDLLLSFPQSEVTEGV